MPIQVQLEHIRRLCDELGEFAVDDEEYKRSMPDSYAASREALKLVGQTYTCTLASFAYWAQEHMKRGGTRHDTSQMEKQVKDYLRTKTPREASVNECEVSKSEFYQKN